MPTSRSVSVHRCRLSGDRVKSLSVRPAMSVCLSKPSTNVGALPCCHRSISQSALVDLMPRSFFMALSAQSSPPANGAAYAPASAG